MVQEGISFLTQVLADVIARTDPEVGSTVEQAGRVRGRALVRPRLGAKGADTEEAVESRLFSSWSGSGSSPAFNVFDAAGGSPCDPARSASWLLSIRRLFAVPTSDSCVASSTRSDHRSKQQPSNRSLSPTCALYISSCRLTHRPGSPGATTAVSLLRSPPATGDTSRMCFEPFYVV